MVGAELDPKNLFGTVGYSRPVDYTIVNGRIRVRDGVLVDIDEEHVLTRGRANINKLLEAVT